MLDRSAFRPRIRRLSVFVCLLALPLLFVQSRAAAAGPGVVTVKHLEAEGKVRVDIGGKLFTEYCYKDYAKPILYPVLGPDGVRMTRDYPQNAKTLGESKDHPHQRSLWFTHGDVNGHSFWHEGSGAGKEVHDAMLEIVTGKTRGSIRTRNKWVAGKDPDKGKTVCTDERVISFFEVPGARVIDYDITIIASEGDVVFGDTKEGTMGIRTHPALRLKNDKGRGVKDANGKALNSEGDRDRDVWGKRATWVDYWARVEGKLVGVAIFNHPKNPVHPTWWHARDYGLIAANPFGVHDFEKKPAHTGDMKIPAGKRVTFRYRFVFHEGDAETAKVPDLYKTYCKKRAE